LAGAEVAGVSAAATFTSPTAGVLPNTGAGKALGLFLLIGVVAVGLGAWMLTKRWGLAFKQV
jgi:LPXTG-motif cell wall-anchored protein